MCVDKVQNSSRERNKTSLVIRGLVRVEGRWHRGRREDFFLEVTADSILK